MEALITTTLDQSHLDCLVESFPEVTFHIGRIDSIGNDALAGARALFCDHVSADTIAAMRSLEWIHCRSAGVDHLPLDAIHDRGLLLTNGRGAHGTPVAEMVIAMMLAFGTGLHEYVRAQMQRAWVRPSVAPKRFELEGQTLLVVGLGHVGSALCRKARGLGMTVVGSDLVKPEDTAWVQRFVPVTSLDDVLPTAHHVALCLPLTPATRGLIGGERLHLMKRGAYLYNVGRGALVDQTALIDALAEGRLAGAGLDATEREPIPNDDPIWAAPNVILTQHSGGASPHNSRRSTDLFSENLHRFMNGYPLLNAVDPELGY